MPNCARCTHGHMKVDTELVGKKKVMGVGRREGTWVGEWNLNALYMNRVVKKVCTRNFQENKGVKTIPITFMKQI